MSRTFGSRARLEAGSKETPITDRRRVWAVKAGSSVVVTTGGLGCKGAMSEGRGLLKEA